MATMPKKEEAREFIDEVTNSRRAVDHPSMCKNLNSKTACVLVEEGIIALSVGLQEYAGELFREAICLLKKCSEELVGWELKENERFKEKVTWLYEEAQSGELIYQISPGQLAAFVEVKRSLWSIADIVLDNKRYLQNQKNGKLGDRSNYQMWHLNYILELCTGRDLYHKVSIPSSLQTEARQWLADFKKSKEAGTLRTPEGEVLARRKAEIEQKLFFLILEAYLGSPA